MEKNTKNLFRITEAARACGVSRSTLMRMEESGLLKPAYVAEDSGRRYYDNFNVAHILQVEKFKAMGLSNEEIITYYRSGGEVKQLLTAMENRLSELERGVEELRLRERQADDISVSIVTLPESTCLTRCVTGRTVQDKYNAMFDFYRECVRKGCKLSDEPIFVVSDRTDYLDGYIGEDKFPFHVCVPIKERTPDAVVFSACKALSVLYYGDYDGVDEAWLRLGKEVKARNLKPLGSPAFSE